jgi:N-acyl-L-homoserine lactone synthetase
MQLHHFTWDDPDSNPALYWEYLKLRKTMFVDGLRWPMPCFKGAEFDFYDLPFASYLFLTDDSARLVAGVRMIRTDNRIAYHGQTVTYMIRDAWRGAFDTIPRHVTQGPPPCDARTWEISRIVSVGGVRATAMVIRGVCDLVHRLGGTRTVYLASPQFFALGKLLGFSVKALGPVIREDGSDEHSYQALETDVVPRKRTPFPAPALDLRRIDEPEAMTA